MKRTVILMLGLVVSMGILVSCGDSSTKGINYDSGKVSMLIPEGWQSYLMPDAAGAGNPNFVMVTKGAETDADLLTVPRVDVVLAENYTQDLEQVKAMYTDIVEVEPFELAGFTWEGFSGMAGSYPAAAYFTFVGDHTLQVNMLLENGGQTISFEDADVQAIMGSIKITAE